MKMPIYTYCIRTYTQIPIDIYCTYVRVPGRQNEKEGSRHPLALPSCRWLPSSSLPSQMQTRRRRAPSLPRAYLQHNKVFKSAQVFVLRGSFTEKSSGIARLQGNVHLTLELPLRDDGSRSTADPFRVSLHSRSCPRSRQNPEGHQPAEMLASSLKNRSNQPGTPRTW